MNIPDMNERMNKQTYYGLLTRRIAVGCPTPFLAASVQHNKLKPGNNGWKHDTQDDVNLDKPDFDLSWE